MKLAGRVKVCGAAYENMQRSVIEEPKEPMGLLIGYRMNVRMPSFVLTNASSIQTADRQPTHVSYGNNAAIERLREREIAMAQIGDTESSVIGQYHGHLINGNDSLKNRAKVSNELSHFDYSFIEEEMKKWNLDEWIEIILKTEYRKYETKRPVSKNFRTHKRKLGVTERVNDYSGYRVLLSAYLIDEKDKGLRTRELKVIPVSGKSRK